MSKWIICTAFIRTWPVCLVVSVLVLWGCWVLLLLPLISITFIDLFCQLVILILFLSHVVSPQTCGGWRQVSWAWRWPLSCSVGSLACSAAAGTEASCSTWLVSSSSWEVSHVCMHTHTTHTRVYIFMSLWLQRTLVPWRFSLTLE